MDNPTPSVQIPDIPELQRAEIMAMEKETTGLYLSGHPMDDYRPLLAGGHVVPIGDILNSFSDGDGKYRDEQIVSVAGIVQKVRQKTTRNNSIMAYVTLEDDTGALETLVFSTVLSQYSRFLQENQPVVLVGRLSVREEKEPQIVVNSVRLIGDAPMETPRQKAGSTALYLKIPQEGTLLDRKVRAILNMFPGKIKTVLYYADTQKRLGLTCEPQGIMLSELRSLLGNENIVLKQ